jgi:hypothetical protein
MARAGGKRRGLAGAPAIVLAAVGRVSIVHAGVGVRVSADGNIP